MIDPKNLGYCCINLSLNLGAKAKDLAVIDYRKKFLQNV